MDARIVDIDKTGRAQRGRRIRFDDSTERTTSASAVKLLSLEPGMSVPIRELESALREIEPRLARDRALRLLGYRERSNAELARRLEDDGFPDVVAAEVVESLQRSGLVDDERFAEHLIRTRGASGFGRQHILHELVEKGVQRHDAESFIEAAEMGSDADRLRTLVAAHPPRDRRERDRLLRRLVNRGFAPGAVLDAVRQLEDDQSDESATDLPV